jgi:neopullulanase
MLLPNFGLRAICLLLFASTGVTSALANPKIEAPSVSKVEPPFWWAGHSINPIRLLVRGENLSGAHVQPSDPQLSLSEVRINSRGTYLFVTVSIGGAAKSGDHSLVLETTGGATRIPFRIETPLSSVNHFQGITTDDVIYLIMPDRFSDGDSRNNSPPGSAPSAFDRANPRAYHGGDFRGIINHLAYLKELGVTALWLTPWYDNWNGINTCDQPWCPNTYYHGYHAIDYYGVEDHFGDMAILRELIEKAHALGLKVIQDQVANHVGYHHPWVKDPPLDDWFHGTPQNHLIERFQNSVLLSPHANRDEVRNTLDGWFSEDLPDMNQDEPEVARYEIQNALWWIGATGVDGIRQDTIQYMPRSFIRDLSEALHRQYPRMWMVGEVFEPDAAQTAFFIGGHAGWDGIDTKLDSDFDFPLWQVSLDVFTGKKPMHALRDQLKYDALYPDPLKITTLTNNHDTPRFMSLAGASLEGAMLHTAFTLTVRGIPQLYYGEEIAMKGKGDPDNRRDFPGGFPGDSPNAFQPGTRSAEEQRMWQWTHDWIKLRRDNSAIRDGRLVDLFYDDEAYVYARQDETVTVMIAINRSSNAKSIAFSTRLFGLGFQDLFLHPLIGMPDAILEKQSVTISLPPRSALAYLIRGARQASN